MTDMRSEVVVIGGGVAGISAAFELSKYYPVTIVEKHHLFDGSSGRNPGRMGLGFHYIDYETSKLYLEASIEVQKHYPHFRIGEYLPFEHPVRHGRYYVMKDSLYTFEEVLVTYRRLQARYAELVAENPENKVFGEPEHFFRILEPHEYNAYINADIVVGGVETCEHLFNWQSFSLHIRQMILSNSNIRLIENAEVVDFRHWYEFDTRYQVLITTRHGENLTVKTNYIINSAWQNIEYLNDKLGITYIKGQRTNRLKCLVEVKLPTSLISLNSSFFCMGSFCMFSNMGDGRGMMTLADVTNMDVSSKITISSEMAKYVNGEISLAEKQGIGVEIKAGVARYIYGMKEAEIIDVKFGIVQTIGEMTLEDLMHRDALHHLRNDHYVREEMQGLISNPAMKLFYFIQNGQHVKRLLDAQLSRELVVREELEFIRKLCIVTSPSGFPSFQHEIFRCIAILIDKMMPNDGNRDVFGIKIIMELKNKVTNELENYLEEKRRQKQIQNTIH
jgi:hypothetical protein